MPASMAASLGFAIRDGCPRGNDGVFKTSSVIEIIDDEADTPIITKPEFRDVSFTLTNPLA